uniref:Ig-like domain-containing protein n=1 Tax=Amphiprion percula TaxID=161767 RepID=A0A3P8STI1_AMPPE
ACKEGTSHGGTELTSTRQLRGAFSDTEDFIDHGLVSANRCSSRTSSISSWTENIKPSFTNKLKFQSVLEGEPVELKCKLVACPTPTILWFHNNRSIPKERRRRIYTDSRMHIHTTSLLIDSIKDKDSGSYKVMAINSEGSAESTASLLVTETPPRCVIPLTNVTAAVGTPVILQCLVNGKPNPTAEWFKDGDRITDSRCIIQEKTEGHFNLLITNVTQSDAGEYKCVIQNPSGCIETAALLKVLRWTSLLPRFTGSSCPSRRRCCRPTRWRRGSLWFLLIPLRSQPFLPSSSTWPPSPPQ